MLFRSLAICGTAAVFAVVASADADAFGRYHRGGKFKTCYKKVTTPPVYKTVHERVMVRPANCHQVRTPPTYGVQAQEVVVRPSYQVVHSKPAVYGRVNVVKQVRPARTRWKRMGCGEYKCAVTTPAKYRTRSKRVMVQPRTSWVETRPAVKQVVHQKVMVHPGTAREVCEPAVYKTVAKQVMVSPGATRWVPVQPAAYHHPVPHAPHPVAPAPMSYHPPMK
ncbi:MAG: hypothetical protein AAGF14_01255 [Pseudomonadota bacterium]